MIQSRVAEHTIQRSRRASLRIEGAKYDARNSRVDDGAGAHDTGFQRAIQSQSRESVVADTAGRFPHRHDFRVGRWIVRRNGMVVSPANDFPARVDDDGTYRDFSLGKSFARFVQRLGHKFFVHPRMLNYSAMKSLRVPVLAFLLLVPLSAMAQGVRMSADFFPLDVGKRWTYQVTNEAGQKVGELTFTVEEYTIVSGVSFYLLSDFPFSSETREPIRYVRYDKNERYFVRKLTNDQGPLFLDDGATTEVLEADSSGSPQKFVMRRDKIALTFQRGVGIIEARMEQSGQPVIAKLAAATSKPVVPLVSTPTPVAPALGRGAPVVLVPAPEPTRREPPVAIVSSENPKIDVAVNPSEAGYQIRMVVTNVSDKLLPFRFSSGQTYDFIVQDASGKEVWRWSTGNFFTQVMRSDSIRSNGKWQFDVVWDQTDNSGSRVPAGHYRVVGIIKSSPPVQAAPVAFEVR